MKTSVVIPAFRSARHLETALPPLISDDAVGEIVVIDNSSDPATAKLVEGTAGRVVYVDTQVNLGFARACNEGARLTRDPVVTYLNPDVRLIRSLDALAAYCASHPRVLVAGGLAGGRGDGPQNARRAVTFRRELGRAVLGSRVALVPVRPGLATTSVPQVDGAFLMARREFVNELGGFDERFELYFEDVDLCRRAREAGDVRIDTRIYGSHSGGGSSEQVPADAYCVYRVSRVRYFAKRWRVTGRLAALLITVVEFVARAVTRQAEGDGVRRRALALATREVWRPGTITVLS